MLKIFVLEERYDARSDWYSSFRDEVRSGSWLDSRSNTTLDIIIVVTRKGTMVIKAIIRKSCDLCTFFLKSFLRISDVLSALGDD
mmetsp:Transcript_6112/g.13376  ORF Transcript_6112/g.13376 Transcript_6112/m.13376 type:complete len:85 (+) Transcript_6112:343-597(+)